MRGTQGRQGLWEWALDPRPSAGPHWGAGTHHFLQLVLNLPVDFGHLEEDISWRGRTAGGERVSRPDRRPHHPHWGRGVGHRGPCGWAVAGRQRRTGGRGGTCCFSR